MTSAIPPSSETGASGPDADPSRVRFTPSHDALPPGARLDEFEIESVLGEGGFGIVYRAMDHALKRQVAIKEYLPAALAGRGASGQVSLRAPAHAATFAMGLRSFVNEARLLAQFDHPSLVRVHRFWEANHTAYMAMPYYEGQTLQDRMRDNPRPPSETWLRGLLLPLLEALEGMHAVHCFHRDIAPDNILLLHDDRPVLLDFGAARRVIADQTQMLTAILKPAYAPIEQYAEADHLQQGPWTDLYALAAVVYFCVAGRSPTPSTARAVDDQLVPFAQLVRTLGAGAPHYSEALISAIDWALAVRPKERPQSVAQFREALTRGQPSGVPRPAPAPRRGGAPQVSTPEEFTAALETRVPAPQADMLDGFAPPDSREEVSEAAVRAALEAALESLDKGSPSPTGAEGVPSFGRPPPRSAEARGSRAMWWGVGLAVVALVGGVGWHWNGDRWGEEMVNLVRGAAPGDAATAEAPGKAVAGDDDAAARALAAAERARLALEGRAAVATTPVEKTSASPAPPPSDTRAPAQDSQPAPPEKRVQPPVQPAAPGQDGPAQAADAPAANPTEERTPDATAPTSTTGSAEARSPKSAGTAAQKSDTAHTRAAEPAPTRRATRAAPPSEPDTPREICAGRANFSLYYCMSTQCDKPRFSNQPQCREFRAQEGAG